MIRLSLGFIYKLSESLKPLSVAEEKTYVDFYIQIYAAKNMLEQFYRDSVYHLKYSRNSANKLYELLKAKTDSFELDEDKFQTKAPMWEINQLAQIAQSVDVAIHEELSGLPAYLVTPKGGYDVDVLTLDSKQAFPRLLLELIPEAKYDVEQAAKCLAYEVPTAAAFHLHKLNELVVRRYYAAVSKGGKKPAKATLGVYITAMEKANIGQPKVLATEKQIKDLHRNPVIHPEINLSVDEAIELFGIVVSAISAMLPTIQKHQEKGVSKKGKSLGDILGLELDKKAEQASG